MDFRLTEESLKTKEDLEAFLQRQIYDGKLNCVSFKVRDLKNWREENYDLKNMKIIHATYYSKFKYFVGGRLTTILSDYRLKQKNKEARERANKFKDSDN
jgi:hypothetical protein